jgi:peptidoglycan/LPS O-acetylase OafA/YrhL
MKGGENSVPSKTSLFRADIEGVRAIAILLVVLYHANIPGFSGGFIGVDVFFVLSGYLITGILYREYKSTGKIDLLEFYSRRIRRLLPALYVVILFTVAAGFIIYSPIQQVKVASTALTMIGYSSNIYFAWKSTDYFADGAETNPLLHTWSLAVEEQFYLVYPLFLVVLFILIRSQKEFRKEKAIVLSIFAVFLFSLSLSIFLTNHRQPYAFFMMPARAWEFAAGALGFLVPAIYDLEGNFIADSKLSRFVNSILESKILGWLGLALLLLCTTFYSHSTLFPGIGALPPVLATLAIICSKNSNDGSVGNFLSVRIFQEIGRLSYSWYLWHWVVLLLADAFFQTKLPPLTKFVLSIIALGISELSYRLIEHPIRHNRFLSRKRLYTYTLAFASTIICFSVAGMWYYLTSKTIDTSIHAKYQQAIKDQLIINKKECRVSFNEMYTEGCSFGNPESSTKVVLYGDSHARQWLPALLELAEENNWFLEVLAKDACPVSEMEFYYRKIGRVYTECTQWRKLASERILKIKPDMLLLSSSKGYEVSLNEWKVGTESILKQLNKSVKNTVIIRDTPRPNSNVPVCLSEKAWRKDFLPVFRPCDFEKHNPVESEIYKIEEEVSKRFENTFVLDMNNYICPESLCFVETEETVLYSDSNHLTTKFVKSLKPQLKKELEKIFLQ